MSAECEDRKSSPVASRLVHDWSDIEPQVGDILASGGFMWNVTAVKYDGTAVVTCVQEISREQRSKWMFYQKAKGQKAQETD